MDSLRGGVAKRKDRGYSSEAFNIEDGRFPETKFFKGDCGLPRA